MTPWGGGAMKCAMKSPRSSSQEATEVHGRLRSQACSMLVRAMGNQFAMTLSPPPFAQTASSYAWRKPTGSAAPLYHGGRSGLNLGETSDALGASAHAGRSSWRGGACHGSRRRDEAG